MLCDGKPVSVQMERIRRVGWYLVRKLGAECLFHWQQSDELEAYSDADCGGDKVTQRPVSAGDSA